MLYKKIQLTIGLIEEVFDNTQKDDDNKKIANRNSIFFDSFEKVLPSISSYNLARKNFDFKLQANTAGLLQYVMTYTKSTFDNLMVVEPVQYKQRVESFNNAVSQEWAAFFRASNYDLMNGLNIIVLVHSNPSEVRNCISSLNKCEKWPLTQEKIDLYIDARKKADSLLTEMRFDDEIKDFLIKVRDKRATLNDLTPSILEWIKSENISDKVCLSIRNTVG